MTRSTFDNFTFCKVIIIGGALLNSWHAQFFLTCVEGDWVLQDRTDLGTWHHYVGKWKISFGNSLDTSNYIIAGTEGLHLWMLFSCGNIEGVEVYIKKHGDLAEFRLANCFVFAFWLCESWYLAVGSVQPSYPCSVVFIKVKDRYMIILVGCKKVWVRFAFSSCIIAWVPSLLISIEYITLHWPWRIQLLAQCMYAYCRWFDIWHEWHATWSLGACSQPRNLVPVPTLRNRSHSQPVSGSKHKSHRGSDIHFSHCTAKWSWTQGGSGFWEKNQFE